MTSVIASLSFVALLAVGCSSSNKPTVAEYKETASDRVARAVSSSTSEEALDSVYQKIMADENPEKRLEDFFSRLVRIYYRSEGYMRAYDAQLDRMYNNQAAYNGTSLITDRSYSRLMSAWLLSDREIQKISYIYKRNYMDFMNKDDDQNPAEAERDSRMKRAMMSIIKKYGEDERLAMQNLLIHLGEVALEAHNEMKADKENEDAKQIEAGVFGSVSEQVSWQKRAEKKSAKKVKDNFYDQALDEEINGLEVDVAQHLAEMFQTREPQSAGDVVASSGPKGNLTGNTFRPGRWALTYDDGPSAKHTPKVLDNLEARGLKTSFMWLASLTPSYPTLIGRAKSLGMALGNHSFSHANLPKQGAASLRKEIVTSTEVHERAYGFKPTYFRCPYGACGGGGSAIRQMIANQGMVHIFWNIDSLDWQDKNPASIVSRVKKAMAVAKKGIILFHDIHPQSVEATRMLMDEWVPQIRSGNLRLVTIPQAIEELNSEAGMQ